MPEQGTGKSFSQQGYEPRMSDRDRIEYGFHVLRQGFNGAVFVPYKSSGLGLYFTEETIRDCLTNNHGQHSAIFNPLNAYSVSEHDLIMALGACREFRERKRLTDQRSFKIE